MAKPLPRFAVRSSGARRSREPGRFTLRPEFCIGLALLLLLLPLGWLAAWVAAAVFHELCHGGMIRLLGYRVLSVSVGAGGAAIETEGMRLRDECLCALAGPVGALLLLLTVRWFPKIAVCACVQSMYNLLPVYPLDGGRAAHCLLRRFVPGEKIRRAEGILDFTILLLISLLGIAATFVLGMGPLPVLCTAVLLIKNTNVKIPCKQEAEKVQ